MKKTNQFILTYRKLVKSDDLNHTGHLFGGRLLQWADEAAVLYAMCQLGSHSVVTLKLSEVIFKNPARSGDILEFWTRKSKIGGTSLGVECVIVRKTIKTTQEEPTPPTEGKMTELENNKNIILSCEFTFVHLDQMGRPTRHQLATSP